MIDGLDHRASERVIKTFSFKVLKRLHALGARSTTLDDVEQELWVAWCKARDSYNPEFGVPFNAYLVNGMKKHVNQWIERRFERFHEETVAASLDAKVADNDGDGVELHGVIASGDIAIEDDVASRDLFNKAVQRLSPRARKFMEILESQPPELMAEVMKLRAKAEFAEQINKPFARFTHLTTTMVFDIMQASQAERTKILKEVDRLGEKIARIS